MDRAREAFGHSDLSDYLRDVVRNDCDQRGIR